MSDQVKVMSREQYEFCARESIWMLAAIMLVLGYLIIYKELAPQIPLLVVDIILMFYAKIRGVDWDDIMDGVYEGIRPGIPPALIFILIGVLIATWIFSGTIPTLMYFGIQVLQPELFLPTVLVICSLMAIICGSSFTSTSTMGIAFMGIGAALSIDPGMTAGAVISGAFFGSNVSPLSSTTNLAADIGKVNIYKHIRTLFWTDGIAWILTLLIFIAIGIMNVPAADNAESLALLHELSQNFWISGWTMVPLAVLLAAAYWKIPAAPSLALGAFVAAIIGWIHDPSISIAEIFNVIMNGYVAHTPNDQMNTLLSKGGVSSMLSSLVLIIFGLTLGGLLIKFDLIGSVIKQIQSKINSAGKAISLTAIVCFCIDCFEGEQYLPVIVPGQLFKSTFDKLGVDRRYLSRIINDAGAGICPLIPWTVPGVFITTALQVSVSQYFQYTFWCLLLALLSVLMGFTLRKGKEYGKEPSN